MQIGSKELKRPSVTAINRLVSEEAKRGEDKNARDGMDH